MNLFIVSVRKKRVNFTVETTMKFIFWDQTKWMDVKVSVSKIKVVSSENKINGWYFSGNSRDPFFN